MVKLPEYVVHGKTICFYKNWGEVAAEEFAGFLSGERIVSKEELRMYASLWNELVEDNNPLRAIVNGKMIGVPEDFYDFIIDTQPLAVKRSLFFKRASIEICNIL